MVMVVHLTLQDLWKGTNINTVQGQRVLFIDFPLLTYSAFHKPFDKRFPKFV